MTTLETDITKLDGCITTRSGKKFNLINPTVDMVDIYDLASGLAYKGHFGGQSPKMFPIAQHSTVCCDLVTDEAEKNDMEFMLCLLLHDSPEGVMFDVPKPIKILPGFAPVVAMENHVGAVIFKRFNLNFEKYKAQVKKYDILAQQIEYDMFFNGKFPDMPYFDPEHARKLFLIYFNRYMSRFCPREVVEVK